MSFIELSEGIRKPSSKSATQATTAKGIVFGEPMPKKSGDKIKRIHKMPTNHTEVQKWFQDMDTRNSGRITARELQLAFDTFQGKHFSDSTCKFVVRLFDLDKNGGLDVEEFEQLYYYVKKWVNAFNVYDRQRLGYLDEKSLAYALDYMDVKFSPEFIKFLILRYDRNGRKITLDQFILTCVQIQKYSEEFRKLVDDTTKTITLREEDFLELILRCL